MIISGSKICFLLFLIMLGGAIVAILRFVKLVIAHLETEIVLRMIIVIVVH